MKSILYFVAFLICSGVYAQDSKDKKEETETKTVKVKTENGTTEKKIKVTTTEESNTQLQNDPKHHENMDIVGTDKTVTKTMSFDYDDDPFYDSSDVVTKQYNHNGKHYMFKPDDSGFMMSIKDDAEGKMLGRARLSSQNRLYLVNMDNNHGVGYFKDDGVFVIEYFDKVNGDMVVKEFSVMEY